MLLILLRFARPQCLAATHLSSPEVGNGLSWPKPQCTCNAMVTSQAQHSTNEGVLRSNSACSMLMSDDHSAAETRNRTPAPGFLTEPDYSNKQNFKKVQKKFLKSVIKI